MKRGRDTVSWLIFSILILLSAKLFIDSNGESIYSWAILLMIPIPLSIIISFQSNEKKSNLLINKLDLTSKGLPDKPPALS